MGDVTKRRKTDRQCDELKGCAHSFRFLFFHNKAREGLTRFKLRILRCCFLQEIRRGKRKVVCGKKERWEKEGCTSTYTLGEV
jgi:hypothetical protein